MWDLLSSKTGERLAREAVHGPVGVRPRSEALVELDRLLVPVEHSPFHAAAPALDSESSQVRQQHAAGPAAAMLGDHEQVLEVDPRPAEEGREVVEEQR